MAEPEGADRLELILAINRFSEKADALLRTQANNATSTVTLSAGSFGVWVSAFCAGITFLMFCVILVLFVNHDRKIDDLGDYLNAIYMMAPQLKPEKEGKESP